MTTDACGQAQWPTREWIEARGYLVAFRSGGFVDCLVSRDDERWVGSGIDEESAMRAALGKMFPSAASRFALKRALCDQPSPIAAPRTSAPEPSHQGPSVAPQPAHRAGDEPIVVIDVERRDGVLEQDAAPTDAPPSKPVTSEPWIDPAAIVPVAAQGSADVALGGTPAFESSHEEDLEEGAALAFLAELRRDAAEQIGDAALLSPDRQRLALLGWICRARAVQERARGLASVHQAVAKFARWITSYSRRFWPGNVPALRHDAEPSQCKADPQLDANAVIHTWQEAADECERVADRSDRDDPRRGLDEYGFADAAALSPCPADPGGWLGQARVEAEAIGGALGASHDEAIFEAWMRDEPSWEPRIIDLASRVRWLRGTLESNAQIVLWGDLMGRLRWAASRFPRGGFNKGLQEVLDPNFRPERSWAVFLGRDPRRRDLRRKRNMVLQAVPNDAALSDVTLTEWLASAFEIGEELPTPRIVGLIRQYTDRIHGLKPETAFPTRNLRKRLRSLQAALKDTDIEAHGDQAVEPFIEEAELPREELHEQTFDERLLARILPHTTGKTALFVTNRLDPDLVKVLKETFGFDELVHDVTDMRRVQAVAAKIANGRFDFVLSATGFQSHKVDGALRDGCGRSKTPLVRVNRARRLACIRGLARELGLTDRAIVEAR